MFLLHYYCECQDLVSFSSKVLCPVVVGAVGLWETVSASEPFSKRCGNGAQSPLVFSPFPERGSFHGLLPTGQQQFSLLACIYPHSA